MPFRSLRSLSAVRSRTPREQPVNWFYWLLALVPLALVAEFLHAPPLAVFIISGLAIIPLSALNPKQVVHWKETPKH